MILIYPKFLWLLLGLVPLALLHLRSSSARFGKPMDAASALRMLAYVLLVLALAHPMRQREDPTRSVVTVIDASASIGDGDFQTALAAYDALRSTSAASETQRLVLFDAAAWDATPRSDAMIGDRAAQLRRTPAIPAAEARTGSVLADALALAGALIPHDGRGRVILHTDGLQTDGDALAMSQRLAQRGIPIDIQTMGNHRDREIVLCSVDLPPAARIGATVQLSAEVDAARAGPAELVVQCDDDLEGIRKPVQLRAGRQRVACACPLSRSGLQRYRVRIVGVADDLAQNNELGAAVLVLPAVPVLVIEDDPLAPGAAAFAALLGRSAEVRAGGPDLLNDPVAMAQAAVVVLADVPAFALPADAARKLADAVSDGLGLLVTGGRRTFGAGGYADSPLADVLPVSFEQEVERRDPSTTLVVIIDTSGSMGGARVNLAKEIARLAIARLKPHDKVGIVEFYGSRRWAAPIQSASNAIDLQRALNRLNAGGGTVILPAIEEAYYALLDVRTRTKHVLVLTDGGVETGAFEPLIRRMADKGITLSAVLVGPGMHSAFLAELAHWGRGRFYTAPDRFNLPEIITKQPQSSLMTSVVEKPIAISAGNAHSALRDLDLSALPPIAGYVRTELRPTADQLLSAEGGDPVLAAWQYGLGKASVLTTQIGGAWSGELVAAPEYAALIANLVRDSARCDVDQALVIAGRHRPGAEEIHITNRLPGQGSPAAAVRLALTDAQDRTQEWTLDPIAAYSWNGRIADLAPGTYTLQADSLDGGLRGSAALVVPEDREVSAVEPDHELLDSIAAFADQAGRRAAALSIPPRRPYELRPWLVATALLAFLLNILVRRWPATPWPAARRTVVVLAALSATWLAAPALAEDDLAALPTITPPPSAVVEAVEAALADPETTDWDSLTETACRLTLQRDGQLDSLLGFLRGKLAAHPNAARLVAAVALRSGQLELARDTLRASATEDTAWSEIGRLEEMLGNDAAALAALDRALAGEQDPRRRFALQVRRALILYDGENPTEGAAALRAAADGQFAWEGAANYCAHLAALNNDFSLAAELLRPVGDRKQQMHTYLFQGSWLLKLARYADAAAAFQSAYDHARMEHDRRFAIDRLVDAARCEGTLAALADRWLEDSALAPDHLVALLGILRELNRPEDALRLIRRSAQTPEQSALLNTADFQREVIALAVEGGQEHDAEKAYLGLLKREPHNAEWRSGLARLMLLDGRRPEAEALFVAAIENAVDPAELLRLAEAAARLSLDAAALRAARAIDPGKSAVGVRAILFQAELARQRGRTDEAAALLSDLAARADDDSIRIQIAEAYERFGDKQEALRLYQQLYEHTHSEDVLLRIAWLLESSRRFDEAMALWKSNWQQTRIPARIRQSQERLLDLAARQGKLADLAIELEEKLDAGTSGERDLALLVDIYTQANDPVSASEILFEFGRQDGNRVAALQRLARVYVSCDQFGRCNDVLQQLVRLDPDNAADYLNQIAIVALERKRPHDARVALDQLAAVVDDSAVVDEFAAGVLDMMGLHEEAAHSYARLVAHHPDRIEAVLLWGNALRDAGGRGQAIGCFQQLVETAEEEDFFTIAVDGLLNLEASPTACRSALRRVYTRIAAAPHKVFPYRLAVDLLESMNRYPQAAHVLEQAVTIAGERRGALLRELMDGAKSDGATDRLIRYGRSLVALSETLPPQVFLDLGEALLSQEAYTAAGQVFDRAGLDADVTAIQQRVAGYYEAAHQPAAADRIIRELLVTEPDSVPLLVRSGNLRIQLSRFEHAFEVYDHAVDLLLRRMPARIRANDALAADDPPEVRRWRATNLDEASLYFDNAAAGLLESAREPEQQAQLLNDLRRRLDQELSGLSSNGFASATLAANPRLERLAAFVRRVAFALHEPDIADAADRELLKRYPHDPALHAAILQTRVAWGLHERALAFAEHVPDAGTLPEELIIDRLLDDPARFDDALTHATLSPAWAARLLPTLVLLGKYEAAERILHADHLREGPEATALAPVAVAAAQSLGDHSALQKWLDGWLNAARRSRPGKDANQEVRRCVRAVWNHLAPEERAGLTARIERLADTLDGDERIQVKLLAVRLADQTRLNMPDRPAVEREALARGLLDIDELVGLLHAAPPTEREEILAQMAAARPATAVRAFLLRLVGALTWEPAAPLGDTIVRLFEHAPPQSCPRDRAYTLRNEGRWNRNPAAPRLGRRIGEVLLGENPNETATLAAVAIARANADAYDEALPLALEALDSILTSANPEFYHRRMLGDLAECLAADDRIETIADLADRALIEGVTPTMLLAQAVLLEAADRTDEAVAGYRAAFEAAPTNRTLSRQVIRTYTDLGRLADLADLLSRHLTKASIMESFEWRTLGNLYCDLYNPRAAAEVVKKDESPLAAVNAIHVARMLGRLDQVLTGFRRFMIDLREKGRFHDPMWPEPPSLGGMDGYLTQSSTQPGDRQRMFDALADLPFAESEYRALLRAAPPDRRDVPGLARALTSAASTPAARQRMLTELTAAARQRAFTIKDQYVLLALAARPDVDLPPELVAVLEDALRHAAPEDATALARLAQLFRRHQTAERAQQIMRWVTALDLQCGHCSTRLAERLEHFDEYLTLLPAEQRHDQRRYLLSMLAPTPVDTPNAALEAARLQRWSPGEDDDLRAAQRARLGQQFAANASRQVDSELAAALARESAIDDDLAGFIAHVRQAAPRDELLAQDRAVVACHRMLPEPPRMARPGVFVDALAELIVAPRGAQGLGLSPMVATRSLCLLGSWCVEHGMMDEAETILQRVQPLATTPDEHGLWIADLAARLKQPALTVQFSLPLLAAHRLPLLRIPPLLEMIEQAGGTARADELAVDAAGYSDHPEILRRAVRWAERNKNGAAAKSYRERLDRLTPRPAE